MGYEYFFKNLLDDYYSAHIYSFHTSNFNVGEIFFLKFFINTAPTIRGMDDYTLKKSQAVVGVAEVGLCCAFA